MRIPTLLHRPGFWLLGVLAVVAGVTAILRARGPVVATTAAVRRDLEHHVIASGRVRVPTRVQISAQLAGLVVAVGAVEGQRVSTGDLLVQIDDAAELATLAQAEAAVSQAKARVDQLRRVGAIVATQALRQTETHLERAQAELARTTKLVSSGAVPAIELDDARQQVAIARAQNTAAEAQQVASAPAGADARVALTSLLQAQAQLAGAKVRLGQTRLLAPQGGAVLTRSVEPGDVVQPGRTLLVVAADAKVELVIQPDERNLAWLQIGQLARASADAYPQRVFDAKVSYIAPAVDAQRGSVEVRLEVSSPPTLLKADMTVSVDLTVAARTNVLTVASEVVRGAASATPWVLIVEAGRVARRDVKIGIHGEGATEIISGIDEATELILPDGRQLEPGARARAERD
jgi:HlyD family secretion protein